MELASLQTIYLDSTNAKQVGSDFELLPFKANGNWFIANDVTYVTDPAKGKKYDIDLDQNIARRGLVDVTGLTEGNVLSGLYLLALAMKPLALPITILQDVSVSPKARFLNASITDETFKTSDIFWQYPDNGISVPLNVSYKFIPLFSRYAVNASGDFILVSDGSALVSGTNLSDVLYLQSDHDVLHMVNKARMVMMAHGKYTLDDYNKEIVFADGSSANLAVTNLRTSVEVIETNFAGIIDLTTDQVYDET